MRARRARLRPQVHRPETPEAEKSVTRQVEHATAYAARKGWTVDPAYVYQDDGISGAEFVNRPGLAALLAALGPRPAFAAVVMSEASRLGREQIETAYVLKRLTDAFKADVSCPENTEVRCPFRDADLLGLGHLGLAAQERLVPVPPVLRELLVDYLLRTGRTGSRDRLFHGKRGRPMHSSTLNAMVKRWGKQAGAHVNPHAFRHSYGTGLAAMGIPLDSIQDWMGHDSLATTAVYLHTAQSTEARDRLDAWSRDMAPRGYIHDASGPNRAPVTPDDRA
jgi:integrase